MGQYYLIVNCSKGEFIHPHKMGDGMKILEFGSSGKGTMMGLAILLANGNGRGGGDLDSENPVIGSWAGDRIVVAGDYGDGGKFLGKVSKTKLKKIAKECFTEGHQKPENVNLFNYADAEFEDISEKVLAALMDDDYFREEFEKAAKDREWDSTFKQAVTAAKALREQSQKQSLCAGITK